MRFLRTLAIVLMISGSAYAGEKGHGGDMLVNEFTGTMSNLIRALQTTNSSRCESTETLDRIFSEVSVISAPAVYVNGVEQDARSYIDDQNKRIIEISRIQLLKTLDPVVYLNLVLHEYYVHLGLETTNRMLRSKDCLDSLTDNFIDLARIPYRTGRMTSTEQMIASGKLGLKCPAAHGGYYQIQASEDAMYVLEFNVKGYRMEYLQTPMVKEYFNTSYDILTGQTSYVFKNHFVKSTGNIFRNVVQSFSLTFSSFDHINWVASIIPLQKKSDAIKVKPFSQVKCHIITI